MRHEFTEDPSVIEWSNAIKKRNQAPTLRVVDEPLTDLLLDIGDMMVERNKKYGSGNIAEFGVQGILVRLGDKFARLRAGQGNFDDETVGDTLDDIIGYALIWKLWIAGQWPGSEK